VYQIDISSKRLEEPEFIKGKDIIYISGNINNEYLIIILKNGSIYAMNGKHQIKYIKSFLVNSLFLDANNKKDKKNFNMSKFKLFASQEMDKIVIANEYFMGIWSQNEINPSNQNNNINNNNFPNSDRSKNPKSERNNNNSNSIEELNGTFYNISLEIEKKALITKEMKIQNENKGKSNSTSGYNSNYSNAALNNFDSKIIENLTCTFGSNYFLGSFGRILYIILIPTEYNLTYKAHLIDYLFRYEPAIKHKANCIEAPEFINESIRQIEKKIIYTYVNFQPDYSNNSNENYSNNNNGQNSKRVESSSNLNNNTNNNINHNSTINLAHDKSYIIMRYNKLSNICAIIMNCLNPHFSNFILFMNETYRVSTYKLYELVSKFRVPFVKDGDKNVLWVEDVEWICNDMLIILLFSGGNFCILNLNFQLLSIVDTSNCLINEGAIQRISCPINLHNAKLKFSDKLHLLSSKKRSDYFIIYSNTYTICFQANNKAFEAKILAQSRVENFDDFLYLMKFYQIHYMDPDTQKTVFEYIHTYVYNMHKDLYNIDQEQLVPNENLHNIFRVFIRFIRIFQSINLIHETNLTILNYLLQISNDFFYILINNKEIWLAFLFINVCENYLLKNLKIKIPKNKICEEQILKGQASYMLINPYFVQNPSLKNISKIRNKILHSRLRLILIFLALIEFRNNQALNINILYFVLGKNCIEKLKKNNMLEDIQMIVKAIIRNYKYLKNENSRAGGEEYILNGLSMNYRSEILSNLIHSRISREDVKFDFFNDFFPLEDMQNYYEINNYYFRGDEEVLINEYNYMNNLGIIQKWLLLFSNFCYFFLFEEVKIYIDNHLRQYLNQAKSAENISPEEMSLSNLIYFNFLFMQLCLSNIIKFFLSFFTQKQNYKSDSSFCPDDPILIEEFSKIFLPTLSPVDIPFLIYEFYVLEDNKNKKNLPFEINNTLNEKIIEHLKPYNFTMNDALDFMEFLEQNNFCSDNMRKETNRVQRSIFSGFIYYLLNINKLSQLQSFESDRDFILKVIDSLDPLLKKEAFDLIYIILNGYLRYYLKLENEKSNLDKNSSKHMEFILTFLKTIFYKLVREEPLRQRFNIHEYISISPSIMKPYLFEGGMFYEYKSFNKIYKKNVFSTYSIIDVRHFINIQKFYERKKADNGLVNSTSINFNNSISNENEKINTVQKSFNNSNNNINKGSLNSGIGKNFTLSKNLNIFPNGLQDNNLYNNKNVSLNSSNNNSNINAFCSSDENLYFLDELLDIGDEENDYANLNNNWFLENIFSTSELNEFYKTSIKNNLDRNTLEKKLYELKESKVDFVKSLKNFIHLIKHSDLNKENGLIYDIELNKEHNRKIIINFIKELKKNNNENENSSENYPDLLSMCMDKIIIGNYDEKINFKFSNNEIRKKIIKSIKLSIAKYLHILNILQIKYFVFKFYNPKKDLLNYLKSLSFLLIYDTNPSEAIRNSFVIIDTLISLNWEEKKKDAESKIIFEIIKHISITMIKYNKNLMNYSRFKVLEAYICEKNEELAKKIGLYFNEEILKIKYVLDNLENFKSENLKMFFISIFIDAYFENLKILQDNLSYYLSKQNSIISLSEARKFYLRITESYTLLTGIPQKGYIYFIEYWDLVNNDVLHNMIINDDFEEIYNNENTSNNQTKRINKDGSDNKYNFILNRRQKYGMDTPRKERNTLKINKNHINIPNCKTAIKKSGSIIKDSNNENNFVLDKKQISNKTIPGKIGLSNSNLQDNSDTVSNSKSCINISNSYVKENYNSQKLNDSFTKNYDTNISVELREEKIDSIYNNEVLNNSSSSLKNLKHNRNLNVIKIKKNLRQSNNSISGKIYIPKYKKDILNNRDNSFCSNNENSAIDIKSGNYRNIEKQQDNKDNSDNSKKDSISLTSQENLNKINKTEKSLNNTSNQCGNYILGAFNNNFQLFFSFILIYN